MVSAPARRALCRTTLRARSDCESSRIEPPMPTTVSPMPSTIRPTSGVRMPEGPATPSFAGPSTVNRLGLVLCGRTRRVGLLGCLRVLFGLLATNTLLDAVAQILVHVAPVLESTDDNRLG